MIEDSGLVATECPDDVPGAAAVLQRRVPSGQTLRQLMHQTVDLAARFVDGVDFASIMVRRETVPFTVARSDRAGARIDQIQCAGGDGPWLRRCAPATRCRSATRSWPTRGPNSPR